MEKKLPEKNVRNYEQEFFEKFRDIRIMYDIYEVTSHKSHNDRNGVSADFQIFLVLMYTKGFQKKLEWISLHYGGAVALVTSDLPSGMTKGTLSVFIITVFSLLSLTE